MKRLTTAACVCMLLLTGQPALAIDSTALFDTKVLGTDIQKSISEIPVGTVIVWPAGSNPTDPENWLECDGRTVSSSKYPELAAIVGANTPNYKDQFLRGGGIAQVGQKVTDSTRSHYHGQPSHTHTVNTMLSSTAVSGSAAAQNFTDRHTGMDVVPVPNKWPSGGFNWSMVSSVSGDGISVRTETLYGYGDISENVTNGPSAVTAHVNNGSASGTAHASGADNTYQNSNSDGTQGGAETAPQHTRVRYLIRALP